MDLLGQYSDSEAEDQEQTTEAPAPQAQRPPQRRNAAPEDDDDGAAGGQPPVHHPHHQADAVPPPASLFNPFASPDAERTASHASASPSAGGGAGGSGGGKRGFVHVTGSGPIQDAPPKASRTAANPAGPKPPFSSGLLLPPQLRNGRANVSTEDVEKIFSKDTLAKRRLK